MDEDTYNFSKINFLKSERVDFFPDTVLQFRSELFDYEVGNVGPHCEYKFVHPFRPFPVWKCYLKSRYLFLDLLILVLITHDGSLLFNKCTSSSLPKVLAILLDLILALVLLVLFSSHTSVPTVTKGNIRDHCI